MILPIPLNRQITLEIAALPSFALKAQTPSINIVNNISVITESLTREYMPVAYAEIFRKIVPLFMALFKQNLF